MLIDQTWNIIFILLAFELISILFIIRSQRYNIEVFLYEFNHEDIHSTTPGSLGFKRKEINLKTRFWIVAILMTSTYGALHFAVHFYRELRWLVIGILSTEMVVYFILWINFYFVMKSNQAF